ncbi:MAG: TonB family protein [Novosphingobium sp.]
MAFVDTRTLNQKLGAGAAVLLIEAGIGLALVAGLTATMVTKPDTRVDAFQVPPTKKPLPPPPQTHEARKDPSVIDRPDVLIKLPPINPPNLPEITESSGDEGTANLGDVSFPLPDTTPTQTAAPLFKPKSAKPFGKWANWVTTNDYPANDLRAEHQGRTSYRLTIDARGAVSTCSITTSSGWPGLDRAACDNVKRRARFEPATDQTGARSAGSYSGAVTWQIPRE